jgi:hypothetical protein
MNGDIIPSDLVVGNVVDNLSLNRVSSPPFVVFCGRLILNPHLMNRFSAMLRWLTTG